MTGYVNKIPNYKDPLYEDKFSFFKRKGGFIQLTSLRIGDEGTIELIKAGRAATQRLNEMGLVPGTRVKLLRRGALRGPVEILARNSHLVIGGGLASKIYVKPIKGGKGESPDEK